MVVAHLFARFWTAWMSSLNLFHIVVWQLIFTNLLWWYRLLGVVKVKLLAVSQWQPWPLMLHNLALVLVFKVINFIHTVDYLWIVDLHINFKEGIYVTLAAYWWAHFWHTKTVTAHCDNAAAVVMLIKSSRNSGNDEFSEEGILAVSSL